MEWNNDIESHFIQMWHDLMKQCQGTTTTNAEKFVLAKDRMNEYARELGLSLEVTAEQCKNKLDSLRKKSRKIYEKVRRATATGQLVESNFDLEEAKAKWAQFHLWHRLFFEHP